MGTIVKRINPSGEVVYRAQIRINKTGYPQFSQSRTFTKKSLAVSWLKKREAEIELNPDILFGRTKQLVPSIAQAIDQYAQEVEKKTYVLRFLRQLPIANIRLDHLKRTDITTHAMSRRNGIPELGIQPVLPCTVFSDLKALRGLLKHAHYVWGYEQVSWSELDLAVEGLKRARLIGAGKERNRLPTAEELQALTNYGYQQWLSPKPKCIIPLHLVIWAAIYSCRREAEITRMLLSDYDEKRQDWLIRDIKHPHGSEGNHKYFEVLPAFLPVMRALMQPDVRTRMQKARSKRIYADSLIPLNPVSIGNAFHHACEKLGIEDLNLHDLRHEGATRLAEDGFTIPQIQKITLHDSWQSLQRYINVRQRSEARLDFENAMRVAQAYVRHSR